MENRDRSKAFGARLTAALRAAGKAELRDGDLAALIARYDVRVTPQTIGYWRNGRHMPKLHQFEGLASFLRMSPGELAFGEAGVAEPKAEYRASDDQERQLVEGFVLLEDEERVAILGLVRALSMRAARQDKRPGPRKRG